MQQTNRKIVKIFFIVIGYKGYGIWDAHTIITHTKKVGWECTDRAYTRKKEGKGGALDDCFDVSLLSTGKT